MAQSSPDRVFTPGTKRGFYIISTVVDVGTPFLRKMLEDEIQKMNPPSLREQLKEHEEELKKELNRGQKKKLYPDIPDTTEQLDISLLQVLMDNLVWLALGTDPAPYSEERKKFENFRNINFGHIASTDLSEEDFQEQWKELVNILVDLGGDRDKINDRLKSSIDPEVEERCHKELQEWRESVMRGQDRLLEGQKRLRDEVWCTQATVVAIFACVCACFCAVYFSQATKSTVDDDRFRRDHGASIMAHFPPRLKTFVGREDVLSKIDNCLQDNQTCLIKGLGGVGKTSVAIEYGHLHAGRYPDGVFWVRLASKGDLCARISQYWDLFERGEKPLHCKSTKCDCTKNLLKMYLTRSEDWLLIVDEAVGKTIAELESLLPHNLKATTHILLSSREQLRLGMKSIPVVDLSSFSATEAQAMFNSTVRPSSEKDRKEIKSLAKFLGHHPLALQFAFAYIEGTGCSVKEYYDKYMSSSAVEKVDLLDEMPGTEQFTNITIRQTFDITFQYMAQLPSKAASSVKLLEMTSFMGPDCIPCPEPNNKYFLKVINTSGKLDELDMKKMISDLKRFSLASNCSAIHPECAFSVNRIVQEVIVAQMNESMRLEHVENALESSTLLLEDSDDTSRVKAEILMAHVHYLDLYVERYKTKVSLNSSSTFLIKSVEFFYRWGACEEAYYFLCKELSLFSSHDPTLPNLCLHIRDHVDILRETLLPCLYNYSINDYVPSEFLIYIADTLFWEGVTLDKKQASYSIEDACSVDEVIAAMDRTILDISKVLFKGKWPNMNWSKPPAFLSFSILGYRLSDSSHDTIFSPNPMSENALKFWNPLNTLVALAERPLLFSAQLFLRLYVDLIGLDSIKMCVDKCSQVSCSDKLSDEKLRHCYNLTKNITKDLHHFRIRVQNTMTNVSEILLMYYQSMDTSTCTNRYYEVMLGLPRENKEFDILIFADRFGNKFLGDPGVVKSVLSQKPNIFCIEGLSQKRNVENCGRNQGAISPLSYVAFHHQVKWKYQLATQERHLRQTFDKTQFLIEEDQSEVFPLQNCSALSVALAEMKKWRETFTLTQLQILDLYLGKIKTNLTDCHRLLSLNNKMLHLNRQIEHKSKHGLSMDIIRDKKLREEIRKTIWEIGGNVSYVLSELLKVIGGNHFVTEDCTCSCPSLRSVFGCENFFPHTLWLWNILQEMIKDVDCSLDHSELNWTCFSKLIHTLDFYKDKSIQCFFRSKQNIKVLISEGRENAMLKAMKSLVWEGMLLK